MTESQINYIYEHHKKYLSIYFGLTEQAVFKWWRKKKIPTKYIQVLQALAIDDFFDTIKKHQSQAISDKIDTLIIHLQTNPRTRF